MWRRADRAVLERGEPEVEQAPVPVRQGGWDKGTADASAHYVAAFRKDLSEVGVVEGQNVTIEYHWLEGRHDRLPALMADLVRRQVAVMATVGNVSTHRRQKLQPRRFRSSLALAMTRSGLVL